MEGDEVDSPEDDLISDPDREAADDRDVEELADEDIDVDVKQAQMQIREVKLAFLKVSLVSLSI